MRKKSKKISCDLIPKVPNTGEDSILYKDLLELCGNNRVVANLIYAEYLQEGVSAKLDSIGTPKDRRGQHRASYVYKFFRGDALKAQSIVDIVKLAQSEGFIDSNGDPILFNDVDSIYNKVQLFNQNSKVYVAYIVPVGDALTVKLVQKDSSTLNEAIKVTSDYKKWIALKEKLREFGINLDTLREACPRVISPSTIQDFTNNLIALEYTANNSLSVDSIALLLALNSDNALVKNALSRDWGNIRETAQRIYEIIHNEEETYYNFAHNILNSAKKLNQLNKKEITDTLNGADMSSDFSDPNVELRNTLAQLDKDYHIEQKVHIKATNLISSYNDLLIEAINSIDKQIKDIEDKYGVTPNSEELRRVRDRLFQDLNAKRGAQGLTALLSLASNQINIIRKNLSSIPTVGTNMDIARALSDKICEARNFINAYKNIINFINTLNETTLGESISSEDRMQLQKIATEVSRQINELENGSNGIKILSRDALLKLSYSYLGEYNPVFHKSTADIVDMMEADSTIFDYLYSVGRTSSTIVNVVGALIRDAQLKRNLMLNDLVTEINNATKLVEGDTAFMYDIVRNKEGKIINQRIISEYDWDTYYKERTKYGYKLEAAGFVKGSGDYLYHMQEWESTHTEFVLVDKTNNRYEQMPIYKIKEDFQKGWTDNQKAYYEKILDIKARIDTLLPAYARHLYVAPQKRTSIDQIAKEYIKGNRSFFDSAKAILDHLNVFKLREDDTNFYRNGIYVGEEEFIASPSNYDNTVLRKIPLFYVNKLKDQSDLTHDFSSALLSLAGTATNFATMSEIQDLCEVASDYVESNTPKDNNKIHEVLYGTEVKVATLLKKKARSSRTSAILDSFIETHLYGMSQVDQGRWAIFCSNLIGFTSFTGLAANIKGATTNALVGIFQNMITATRGQYYNFIDLIQATAILFGKGGAILPGIAVGASVGGVPGAIAGLGVGALVGIKELAGKNGKIMDILTNTRNSKDTLLADYFDVCQESYNQLSNKRYHSHMFTRLFGQFDPMALYSKGEYFIHMLNLYAMLLHEKVLKYNPETKEREAVSLYSVIKTTQVGTDSKLDVEDNISKMDGTKIDEEYFKSLIRRLRYINQRCHGSMNREDKGLIHKYMIGRLVMNFRQWAVEHWSRRYRGIHWDSSIRDFNISNFFNNTKVLLNGIEVPLYKALNQIDSGNNDGTFTYTVKDGATTLNGETLTDEVVDLLLDKAMADNGWVSGFKIGAIRVLRDYFRDSEEYGETVAAYWNSLTDTQKGDVKETLGAMFLFSMLSLLSLAMGEPDDHKREQAYRFWLWVVKKIYMEEKASSVFGIIPEFDNIVNNILPSLKTANGLLYPIMGILNGDLVAKDDNGNWYMPTMKGGRDKGDSRYWHYIKTRTIPFYGQIKQFMDIGEDDSVFYIFDNGIR